MIAMNKEGKQKMLGTKYTIKGWHFEDNTDVDYWNFKLEHRAYM